MWTTIPELFIISNVADGNGMDICKASPNPSGFGYICKVDSSELPKMSSIAVLALSKVGMPNPSNISVRENWDPDFRMAFRICWAV